VRGLALGMFSMVIESRAQLPFIGGSIQHFRVSFGLFVRKK
jgi:hypothetical protein